MRNFHDILEGTVIQINKLLRYDCLYFCISSAVSIYILLFINDLYSFVYKPLHVAVKYNARDKIYRITS